MVNSESLNILIIYKFYYLFIFKLLFVNLVMCFSFILFLIYLYFDGILYLLIFYESVFI